MTEGEQQGLSVLAKLVIAFGILLVVAGIARYGIAIATFQRLFRQLIERPGEPMAFRFILQPVMAAIVALRDGRNDARLGRAPYLWTMLHRPNERVARLQEGLNATARIILLGLVMDAIYQLMVLERFYPAEAVIIALLLAFVPYVILRGIVLRVARRWPGRGSQHQLR